MRSACCGLFASQKLVRVSTSSVCYSFFAQNQPDIINCCDTAQQRIRTRRTMPSDGKSNGRFQLPQLAPVNFSLTDGTDIPPPPDSPVEEKPRPPTHLAIPQSTTTTTITTNGSLGVSTSTLGGNKRGRSDEPPLSPASTGRPSSIRRFLSKKSLNANFVAGANGIQEDAATIGRPDSRASAMTDVNKKRSRSWFRRLSGSNLGRSNSTAALSRPVPEEKKGPPPPKLPELNQFKAQIPEGDEGSLGAEDMFKNIK